MTGLIFTIWFRFWWVLSSIPSLIHPSILRYNKNFRSHASDFSEVFWRLSFESMDSGMQLRPPADHHLPSPNFFTNFTLYFTLHSVEYWEVWFFITDFVIVTFFHLYTYCEDSIMSLPLLPLLTAVSWLSSSFLWPWTISQGNRLELERQRPSF